MQLSWDLHIHPGQHGDDRWGSGLDIWKAASMAGVSGFLWKDHDRRIETQAATIPRNQSRCHSSLVLNSWATPQDVMESLEAGIQWFWGPTRDVSGHHPWNLPLPTWWPEARNLLLDSSVPLVLSTGHLGIEGRLEFANIAAASNHILCSITHCLYLPQDELATFIGLGTALEFDLFTAIFPIPGRPVGELSESLTVALELGGLAYLTSDAGQRQIGNPFKFTEEALDKISLSMSKMHLRQAAIDNPKRVAAHLRNTQMNL